MNPDVRIVGNLSDDRIDIETAGLRAQLAAVLDCDPAEIDVAAVRHEHSVHLRGYWIPA